MLGGVCLPAGLTQVNLRHIKAGTFSANQSGDHVRANTFMDVNSTVGYEASFRFAALGRFLIREPHESLLYTGGTDVETPGFYKPSLTETFTEAAAYEDHDMITRLVKEWELAAQMPERKDIKQYQLRLGVVLAENSNFVKSLYPSHRVGLGGPVASGRQWISWIHLDDVVRIVQYLLDPESSVPVGPVNATAPFACRQEAVSKAFSEAVNAPSLPFGPIRTPAFVAKLILGSDRSTLLLEGQRVVPKKLLDAGFNFKYPRLEDALEAIFQRRPTSVPTD
ncbi:hypothetical protein CRM22_005114 [Opisthorchis felineus]|uniref:DUF1731 domain-containing protein n=1 Tax=Opisthorchis felineus TaxID=147828 RepID=A0A4S2LST8_OPIFE|nr:hypothetical protein CRM22_005114 [Opisthorchis felineus]